MKQKLHNTTISDFVKFNSYEGGKKYKVLTNANGEETDIELRGRLTTFDMKNANGYKFKSDSYDKYVDEYFIANSLNVPVCLLHNDTDIRNLCGKVTEMVKNEDGIDIVVKVPKCSYYYNLIKGHIDAGVLQGFSNYGGLVAGWYDDEDDSLVIEKFQLLHAALVCNPGDTTATFDTVADTKFVGFEPRKAEVVENNEKSIDEDSDIYAIV